jgi:hypothetical protein
VDDMGQVEILGWTGRADLLPVAVQHVHAGDPMKTRTFV